MKPQFQPWQFLLLILVGWINRSQQMLSSTSANIFKDHGIEPAPDRKRQSTWKTFLKAHWDVLASVH